MGVLLVVNAVGCYGAGVRAMASDEAEKNEVAVNLQQTMFDMKRLIKRKFDNKKVQKGIKLF